MGKYTTIAIFQTQSLAQAGLLMTAHAKYSMVQSLHDDQTIKEEAKTTSFHLSMKRAAVHTTEAWFALHLLGYSSDVLPPIAHHPSLQGDNSHGPQRHRGPQAGSGASQSLPCLIPRHIHFPGNMTVSGCTYCGVGIKRLPLLFVSQCIENRACAPHIHHGMST